MIKFLASLILKIVSFVGWLLLTISVIWSFIALWHFDVIWLPISRIVAVAWLLFVLLVFVGASVPVVKNYAPEFPRVLAITITLIGVFLISFVWRFKTPSGTGPWNKNQSMVPFMKYEDTNVTIHNFRNSSYRSVSDYDEKWETRTYSLDKIRTLDIIVEPFMPLKGMSHIILSFGFEDGEYVAVSVEARKPDDRGQNVVTSMFKAYELIYVVGDERDLVHHRIFHRDHDVSIYRLDSRNREHLRAFFILVMNHAASMERYPQYYHTITNNCTNSVFRHLEYLLASKFPWYDYRLVLPGYLDDLLFEWGAFGSDYTLDEIQDRAKVDSEGLEVLEGISSKEWSALLRKNWNK